MCVHFYVYIFFFKNQKQPRGRVSMAYCVTLKLKTIYVFYFHLHDHATNSSQFCIAPIIETNVVVRNGTVLFKSFCMFVVCFEIYYGMNEYCHSKILCYVGEIRRVAHAFFR